MGDRIKFGMPTLIEKPRIDECVALCRDLGLDFIEINMNLPNYQIGVIDIDKFLELSSVNNIFFTIHLDENLNIWDFNDNVSKAYIDTVLQTINYAKKMNISILDMHMATGVYFTLPNRKAYLFGEYKDIYLRRTEKFRDVCTEIIGDRNIKICIENYVGYTSFMKESLKILLESDVFALTWDVGHDYANNNIDTPFILQNKDRIMHMHIHDVIGKNDHIALGDGEIDIAAKVDFAKNNKCTCVIEAKTIYGLKKSVAFLKKQKLFN